MQRGIESAFELRKKMLPVLETKVNELKRIGITYITAQEIWNYLADTKWKFAEGLTLSEMTNDILSLEVEK